MYTVSAGCQAHLLNKCISSVKCTLPCWFFRHFCYVPTEYLGSYEVLFVKCKFIIKRLFICSRYMRLTTSGYGIATYHIGA